MREIVGSTAEETRLIKAIQRMGGALDNGIIGTDTLTTLAIQTGADCWPLAVTMYGQPACIAPSLTAFDPNGPIKNYEYAMSGSFTWPAGQTPCSILVNRGKVLCEYACHFWEQGKPESVMFQMEDGTVNVRRMLSIAQLPDGAVWAVGGMGLLDKYDPVAEGFTGNQAGALRKTGHIVLGTKNGMLYGVAFQNHTADSLNQICRNKFCFEHAIMLDGGSVFSYNFKDKTRALNATLGYAIQFIKEV